METDLALWFNTSSQGVAFVEPVQNAQGLLIDFRYKLVNKAFAHMVWQTQEALTGQMISINTLGEEFIRSLETSFQTGEPQHMGKRQEQAGESLWQDITLTPMGGQIIVTIQDVSEQKRYEHSLQRRLAMESIISTISSRFITLKTDQADRYISKALQEIGEYIDAERASVFMYSDDYQEGYCMHEWCTPGHSLRKAKIQNRPQECFDWMRPKLENGEFIRLQINELTPDQIQEKAFFDFISVYSMIAVPLIQKRKTQGFIGFYTISKPHSWDQNDISLLETFSTLIANVLLRLQQEAAIQRVNYRLEGLHAIDQALLNSRINDQPPLSIAMQYMYSMVPCNRISVFQINRETGLAEAQCRVIEGELETNPTLAVPARYFDERFLQNQIPTQLIYYPDVQTDTTGIPPDLLPSLNGFRSQVTIPLYSQKDCIGAFTLMSVTPHFFKEEYLQIAQEVGRLLAIGLRQQQLDKQLKGYTELLEWRVEERTQEIRRLSTLHQAILKHAGQAIVSTDMNGVIQTANQACEYLLGYRPDELIGRQTYLEPGTTEHPLPVVVYRSVTQDARPATRFAEILAAEGFFYCECVASAKSGRLVPILLAVSVLQDDSGAFIGYVGISTDISALKKAELKLQQTNQELNTFFEGSLDMHCIADSRGNIWAANQAFQATLGYSATELMRIPFLQLIHPDEQKFVYKNLLETILEQPIRNQINRMRRKDGSYRIIEWNAVGINQVVYGSARDITERQEAESQLRSLNQRLQLATQAAGQGLWEKDLITDSLFWDDQMWQIFGEEYRQPDWRFEKFLAIIHPDDVSTFQELTFSRAQNSKQSIVSRIIRPDGNVRYIEANGLVIQDEKGKPIRAIGVAWDVTKRKLAEAALLESEQRFRDIADNVDEVFWIHATDPFRLLYVNSAYERIWNRSCQSLYENPFSFLDTIYEEDRPAVAKAISLYEVGEEVSIQCRGVRPDSTLFWMSVRTFIIRDETGTVTRQIGIANDITSQKEKELVLQQSLRQEQELNQLKSQFVATASHEFRTPLATIQSSVDLIKLYLDLPIPNARASIEKHLSVIEKEIEQFSALLTDILTIGRIESKKVSFSPRSVDAVLLCEEIIATHFSHRNDNRAVDFSVVGVPHAVYVDDKLISHVIVNVLSNAFKFSKSNPTLRLIFDEQHLVFEVVDQGIGIPEKELSALFQAFFRASNTSGIPGTGLGLVIARQFIELHGGHFAIQSQEKQGTTCTISLPVNATESILIRS
ncbi:PAS domain S-box protein [Spirosoma aerolatum]|uniref:PAS domain S-box protein n=1 Tax=Spirosoma aerolatum TaxID=1211326 RepID=UPI0009AD6B63|nr:PAS domain S-box protein [Spirosoma aerolatum]